MSRVAILKTVPFKREQENIIGFTTKQQQQEYFANLAGKSTFDELFIGIGERNFLPSTDTLATLRIDLKSYPTPFNTIEALNCQYAIVNYEYASGSSNWGSGYLFYFITYAKSVNMNTIEYTLELDVFNTYLRGVDWDYDSGLYDVDRCHIRRYLYIDDKLEPYYDMLKYMYVDDINPPISVVTDSLKLSGSSTGFYYAVIKPNVTEKSISWDFKRYIGETTTEGNIDFSIMLGQEGVEATRVPYAILMFASNNVSAVNGTNIKAQDIHKNIISIFGSNLVTIFKSDLPPQSFTDWNYNGSKWVFTGTAAESGAGTAWSIGDNSVFLGFVSGEIGGGFQDVSTDYKINLYGGTLSKNSKISDDIKMNLYRELHIITSNDNIQYNLLKTENVDGISIRLGRYISDNGIVITAYIADGFYANNYKTGDVAGKISKLDVPTLCDSYRVWQQENKNYMYTAYLLPTVVGAANTANNAFGAFVANSPKGPTDFAGAAKATGAAAHETIKGVISIGDSLARAALYEDDRKHSPDRKIGSASDLAEQTMKFGTLSPVAAIYEPSEPVKNIINRMWYMYGYPINNLIKYDRIFDLRTYFNFIKFNTDTSDRIISKNSVCISNNIADYISSRFQAGVRIWNARTVTNEFKFQDLENWEYDIYLLME